MYKVVPSRRKTTNQFLLMAEAREKILCFGINARHKSCSQRDWSKSRVILCQGIELL